MQREQVSYSFIYRESSVDVDESGEAAKIYQILIFTKWLCKIYSVSQPVC